MNKAINNASEKIKYLNGRRLNSALRVPRGIADEIIKHVAARSIAHYLELKPLFKSGVIFNDGGHIPHEKIAGFLNISLSGWRGHYNILKRFKLLTVDYNRNIKLSGWRVLNELITGTKQSAEHQYKTHNLPIFMLKKNETFVYEIIQTIAIYENLQKQKRAFRYKLAKNLALNSLAEKYLKSIYCKKNTCEIEQNKDFNLNYFMREYLTSDENNYYLDAIIEKYKSKVDRHFLTYEVMQRHEYRKKYLSNYDENNTPNPFYTLSVAAVGRLFNKSNSTAFHLLNRLKKYKFIDIEKETIKTSDRAANGVATWEHYDRPNFTACNPVKLHVLQQITHQKNIPNLYNTVVKMFNVLEVNII